MLVASTGTDFFGSPSVDALLDLKHLRIRATGAIEGTLTLRPSETNFAHAVLCDGVDELVDVRCVLRNVSFKAIRGAVSGAADAAAAFQAVAKLARDVGNVTVTDWLSRVQEVHEAYERAPLESAAVDPSSGVVDAVPYSSSATTLTQLGFDESWTVVTSRRRESAPARRKTSRQERAYNNAAPTAARCSFSNLTRWAVLDDQLLQAEIDAAQIAAPAVYERPPRTRLPKRAHTRRVGRPAPKKKPKKQAATDEDGGKDLHRYMQAFEVASQAISRNALRKEFERVMYRRAEFLHKVRAPVRVRACARPREYEPA